MINRLAAFPRKKFPLTAGMVLALCPLAWAQPAGDSERRMSVAKRTPKYHLRKQMLNLPNYDERLIHYGFFLAVNYSSFRVKPSQLYTSNIQNPRTSNPLWVINPIASPGFTTGFILNLRIHDFFDFRFLPTVAFYQRAVEFRYRNDSVSTQLNQSTYSFVELPMLVKYKSQRRGNRRFYVVGGIKPSIEVGAKRDEIGDDFLRTNASDLSIDYGFGMDIYYPLFKFSPEIRFSHGLRNMKYPDSNVYANSLSRLTSHTIMFIMNFE